MEIIEAMSNYQMGQWTQGTGLPAWAALPALVIITVIGIALMALV